MKNKRLETLTYAGLELLLGAALGTLTYNYSRDIYDYISNFPIAQNAVAYGLRELSSVVVPAFMGSVTATEIFFGLKDLYDSLTIKKEGKSKKY